nr:TIGR03745 family integrating conjugative element membrane protein [Stutzerimonas stutzeri]
MQNRILNSHLAQRTAVVLGAAALPALSFAQGLPQLET